MRSERIDFSDTDTALVTVRAIVDTFYDAVSHQDVPSTRAAYQMLADAIAGVTRLIEAKATGLRGASMGAAFPPTQWKDMSPEEIIRDLQNLVAMEELAIEIVQTKVRGSRSAQARQLSNQVARMIRALRAKVFNARAWIMKHWPDHWTINEESTFERWL